MLTVLFGKKKISEDKMANVFVNAIFDIVENSFSDIAGLINESPHFIDQPNVSENQYDDFLMIVITGNIKFLSKHFDTDQEKRLRNKIFEKFGKSFGVSSEEFYKLYKEAGAFMMKVNHPSKNVLYSMSKALFYKYNLNEFQEDYFKVMNTPNPLFLKKMDDIMVNYIWNWENYLAKFKFSA